MNLPSKYKTLLSQLRIESVFLLLLGSAILSFGLYNIHDVADITEGGILGLDLLLEYWLNLSPSVTNFVFTAVCFLIGWKALGLPFILRSAIAVSSFSVFYVILEHTPRLFPGIANHPWLAALVGALFVGVGAGICVREGGAQSGDDALALAFREFFGWKVSSTYLVSDLIVLLLSLTYIPVQKILCSLLTVILSGQIIELVCTAGKKPSNTNII